MSKPAQIFLTCFALAAGAAGADQQRPGDAVRAIVDNELQFAKNAAEHGTRAAFLEFLADGAVIFDPAPVNAKKRWHKRTDDGSLLSWHPEFAAVSRAADIGYDTGPWEWRKDKAAPKPEGFGHFVSVWKKQRDGRWKVALDCGIDHPDTAQAPNPVEMSYSDDGLNESVDLPKVRKAAQAAQREFLDGAKSDAAAALLKAADDSVRVYRQGLAPAVGRESAGLMLGATPASLRMTSIGGGISRTGDLGYDYGRYSLQRAAAKEVGHYLQIWRTDASGSWKLVLDLERKLPPGDDAAAKSKTTSGD